MSRKERFVEEDESESEPTGATTTLPHTNTSIVTPRKKPKTKIFGMWKWCMNVVYEWIVNTVFSSVIGVYGRVLGFTFEGEEYDQAVVFFWASLTSLSSIPAHILFGCVPLIWYFAFGIGNYWCVFVDGAGVVFSLCLNVSIRCSKRISLFSHIAIPMLCWTSIPAYFCMGETFKGNAVLLIPMVLSICIALCFYIKWRYIWVVLNALLGVSFFIYDLVTTTLHPDDYIVSQVEAYLIIFMQYLTYAIVFCFVVLFMAFSVEKGGYVINRIKTVKQAVNDLDFDGNQAVDDILNGDRRITSEAVSILRDLLKIVKLYKSFLPSQLVSKIEDRYRGKHISSNSPKGFERSSTLGSHSSRASSASHKSAISSSISINTSMKSQYCTLMQLELSFLRPPKTKAGFAQSGGFVQREGLPDVKSELFILEKYEHIWFDTNKFLEMCSNVIKHHGGVIESFQDNMLLVSFNLQTTIVSHSLNAICVAEKIKGLFPATKVVIVEGKMFYGIVGFKGFKRFNICGQNFDIMNVLSHLSNEEKVSVEDSWILLNERCVQTNKYAVCVLPVMRITKEDGGTEWVYLFKKRKNSGTDEWMYTIRKDLVVSERGKDQVYFIVQELLELVCGGEEKLKQAKDVVSRLLTSSELSKIERTILENLVNQKFTSSKTRRNMKFDQIVNICSVFNFRL